jgi:hypothetical protein
VIARREMLISLAPGGSITFWELARFAKIGHSAVKSTENLTRTSPAPIPGLLTGMEEEIGKSPRDLTKFPKLAIQNRFQSDPAHDDAVYL